ncbi:MAG: HD domain-containing protein [Eubacterium sp.]|jgi:putative nucleotidyltransferase with HDIG domain|nr:HD domain-containing protein [Eubacterium sp.]
MNVRRHSLIFGLSYALDIAGKNNLSHSKSTAYLSVMMGKELGINGDAELSLYYAALLHDIGISNEYVMYEHCVIGAEMLKKLPLQSEIYEYVHYHHEFYNGSGPFGLSGADIPKAAQIICLASLFDDKFGKMSGNFDLNLFLEVKDWLNEIKDLFSEDILSVFDGLIKQEAFLLNYFNHETKYKLSEKAIIGDEVCYGYEEVLQFALCFADIIDRRSSFTYTHSHGIAKLSRIATEHLGYGTEIQNKMYIAGLLHDIGKLHVSTDILHKNGSLTPEERFEINKHTYYTRKILEQIPELEDVVDYAANHHEKLDGTGYPYHIARERLSELERVMAICDVYQALTEERPYRASLPNEKVWSIIDGMADNGHLDGALVQNLKKIWLFPSNS